MNSLGNDFLQGLFVGFLLVILFCSNPAFAYSVPQTTTAYFADTNAQSAPLSLGAPSAFTSPATTPPLTTPPALTPTSPTLSSATTPLSAPTSTIPPGSCSMSRLDPKEAQAILDLTHDGFNGKKITDGSDTNTVGKDTNKARDIGKTEVIGKDVDGKNAVKQDAPNFAATADKFSFLNGKTITGPFGVGLILDDTLRIGRCDGLAQNQCLINGEGLGVRTSGVGFKDDIVNAFESTGATKSPAEKALSADDYNKLRANYFDVNSKDFTVGSFAKGETLRNSITTKQFTARNATTCNNSACIISTYSAFDKYFNTWMTTTMVATTIGPMLLQKSYKLLNNVYKSTGANQFKSKWAIPEKLRDKITGITSPLSVFGTKRDARFKALMLETGLTKSVEEKLVISRALWSSGSKGEVATLLQKDSVLWKLDPETRRKAYEAIEHLGAYARQSATGFNEARANFDAAIKAADALADPVLKKAAQEEAKLEFGKYAATNLDHWDEVLALDFEDWAKANDNLFDFSGFAVKKNGPGGGFANDTGYVDIATGQPFNLKRIVQQFGENGSWSKWAGSTNAETFQVAADGVSIQLYKIAPKNVIAENVGLQDLRFHLSKMGSSTYSVKLPSGKYIPLNESSIKYIESDPLLAGHVSIFESAYVPAEPLTPLDFANRITDKRITGRTATAVRNMDELKYGLTQNNYVPRSYSSLLDKQFADEGDMISAYYKKPPVGLWKGTALPILYWNAKKGFGNEQYSGYMLPDTWSALTVSQGVDQIYKDSYIDFYANEGSDQGDMFKRAFTSLPFVWNSVINMVSETNQFVKDNVSKVSGGWFTGSGAPRDTVRDVAFYSHNENCSGCVAPFNVSNSYLILNGFTAPVNMQAFLLEASDDATRAKEGTVLISYTHHSNLSGKTGSIEGEAINISQAGRDGTTCAQKLEKLHLGWAGRGAGGVLAGAEALAYVAGFGPGLIGSFVNQMYFSRELQDCVDADEGYYMHFFAPPAKDDSKAKSKETVSNETVSSALAGLSTKMDDYLKDQQGAKTSTSTTGANPIENSMNKLKDQFNQFATKAKQANILQASVDLSAPSHGSVQGRDVFYVWFKDTLMPVGYNTTGKSVTSDGNNSVEEDYANGTLKINGKTVLGPDKADHVRLAPQDNRIPAKVIPMTLNKVGAPMTDATVFELNTLGEIRVLEPQVLNCIQKAIFDQSGIKYTGNELTQAFGALKQLSTENYGSVTALGGKIYLEGTSPRMQGEMNSRFIVNGYWSTKLVTTDINGGFETGKFIGMTFEHGSIILKPETNELIIYLRQFKDSVLSQADVKGLEAKLTSVKDPLTECDVPAIDLSAVPNSGDELGAKKVENFNTSMQHLGPFTQFTTPTKIYEFYSQRDGNSGACKNYFRVRDKETGKILTDQEIVGGITQSPDGTLHFKTADGKDNTLNFSAEGGVPKVSYNNGPKETLLTAQGPNGSFWYDPEKGLWYPENGLQIPLNQAFKDNGAWFGADKNGNVTGTPENKMTFNVGQQGNTGFSLPSVPETAGGLVLFVSLFLFLAYTLTYGRIAKVKRKR